MVERKTRLRRRYIDIPGSETPEEDTRNTFQIQARVVGPTRRARIGGVLLRAKDQAVRQPRRSDVAVGYRPVTGDNAAVPFKQDGVFPHEDDVIDFPRQAVIFEGLRNEITAARKRRTTRLYWRVSPGEGAIPGFRMPSKLEVSSHLPPKLQHNR